jgi:hypothetical protein
MLGHKNASKSMATEMQTVATIVERNMGKETEGSVQASSDPIGTTTKR